MSKVFANRLQRYKDQKIIIFYEFFLFRGEVGREEEILKQWMDVGITETGLIKLFLQWSDLI